MLITGLALISWGAYSAWAGIENGVLWYVISGGIFIAGGIAVLFRQRWSRFLVYALALWVSGGWVYVVWLQYSLGRVPHRSAVQHSLGLLPGLLLLGVCAGLSYVVHKRLGKDT